MPCLLAGAYVYPAATTFLLLLFEARARRDWRGTWQEWGLLLVSSALWPVFWALAVWTRIAR